MRKRKSKKRRLNLGWVAVAVLAVVFVASALAQNEPNAPALYGPNMEEELRLPGRVEGTGTYFDVADSNYLNITFESSEPVNLRLESVPQMIVMDIKTAEGAASTKITLTGFEPSTTYYKYEDNYRNEVTFTTDSNGSYAFAQDLTQPHLVFIQPQPGTKFIPSDTSIGTWDPVNRIYTLTIDVSDTIQIDEDNLTLDGAGHTVTGPGGGFGVYLPERTGVTIKNVNVHQFTFGIYLYRSSSNTLTANTVSTINFSGFNGIYLYQSSNNILTGNNASSTGHDGICLSYSNNNTLTANTANWNIDESGIELYRSNGNTLTGNRASNNSLGISIYESSNNILTANTASNNANGYAIRTYASDNTLTGNIASDNVNGIIFLWSSSNTLTGNTLISNNHSGMILYGHCDWGYSSNNQIYNNNFIENGTQAYISFIEWHPGPYIPGGNVNVFNLDKPIGGNYWSDWCPPLHPDNDGDGFVDYPYEFYGGIDYPPLASPYVKEILYVDAVNGNDNNNGLSRRTAFATIAKGIDSATNRYKVLVYPGVYQEEVDFKGKAITVQGVATKAGIPVIENPGDFAVSFYNGEGPRSILKNFVIRNSFMAIFIAGSSPTLKNLNIIGNKYGVEAYAGSQTDISNCIFWNNSDSDLFDCEARYSWVQSAIEPQPGRGLIAYWNFDEGSGSIAHDSVGGNNGTIYGAQWTGRKVGGALNFDGQDDYVEVPDADCLDPVSTQEITLSSWVNISTYVCPFHPACYFGIVNKTATTGRDNGNYVFAIVTKYDPVNEGKLRFGVVYNNLQFQETYSDYLVPKDQWVHVAVTHDAHQKTSFYIDGVLAGTDISAITTDFANSTKALTIGHTNSYSDYFLGQIDEVCIYNRALSAQEIQQLSRGGLTSNPLFADPANDDYHLLSQRGRYWPRADVWVLDKVTSPCVDGGDPNDDVSDEPMPNGGRIDMGAYGGTPFASMSEIKWLNGDINHDGRVNLADLAMLAENWLLTGIGVELPANYNWLSYNGHHYALTLQYGVWEQAEAEAVAVGGHLVTINDQAENDWLAETFKNIYTQGGLHNIAWIGLEYVSGDRSNPNSWRWVNGEPVTYWRPYSYGFDPAGNHMYIEGNSQIDPGGWCNGTAHETDPSKFPRGIIEVLW